MPLLHSNSCLRRRLPSKPLSCAKVRPGLLLDSASRSCAATRYRCAEVTGAETKGRPEKIVHHQSMTIAQIRYETHDAQTGAIGKHQAPPTKCSQLGRGRRRDFRKSGDEETARRLKSIADFIADEILEADQKITLPGRTPKSKP